MNQVYVKCDHVSPADVKMGRTNEVEIVSELFGEVDATMGFIHLCNSCKASFGDNYSETVVM